MTDKKQPRSSHPESAKLQSPNTGKNNRRPNYKDMVKAAIVSQRKPRGSSAQEILNYICSNYNIIDKTKAKHRLKNALVIGVKTGLLEEDTSKKTTRYFTAATDDNIRHPTRLKEFKKSSPLPSLSKRARVSQKSDLVNSSNPRIDKSSMSAVNRNASSPHNDKAKAIRKAPVAPASKPQKDKSRKSRANTTSDNIRSKAANQTAVRYGGRKNQNKGPNSMPSSKHLISEEHLNSSELQSTSSAGATEQPMPIPDIRASLLTTYRTKPSTLSHHQIAVAPDGKKLILERHTWSVKLYAPDMKLLSRIQLEPPVRDIAIAGENQALVTTDDVIYFVDFSNDKMSVSCTLNSTEVLYGITKCKEHIYVTCENDKMSVQMLDVGGNIHWSVSKDRKEIPTCYNPADINSFIDNGLVRLVVIDDFTLNILDGQTGEILSTRSTTFGPACSVAIDMYNNIYICYFSAGVVSVLRSDLSNERVLITSKSSSYKSTCPANVPRDLQDNPTGMAYDQNSNRLLICDIGGKVQLYQLNTSYV